MLEMSTQKVALLIDWANSKGADFRRVVQRARELGQLEFAAAYGAWGRPDTWDDEKLFLALGVEMVHCPRWPVSKNPDGSTRFKCTDDALFHRDLLRLPWTQPEIEVFLLAGADTDSLASACLAEKRGKEVAVMYNPYDGSLGHVMRLGNFRFEELPMLEEPSQQNASKELGRPQSEVPFEELPSVVINEVRSDHNGAGAKLN